MHIDDGPRLVRSRWCTRCTTCGRWPPDALDAPAGVARPGEAVGVRTG